MRDLLQSGGKPLVMGVINTTPDSFYAASRAQGDAALQRACSMVEAGVDIIDVGGEATNPMIDIDTAVVPIYEELDRVISVIEQIKCKLDVAVSIDTSKPEVMHAAVAAGADMINDQRALTQPGALDIALKLDVPVCLMHMVPRISSERTLQQAVDTIQAYLMSRAQICMDAGIAPTDIIIDPGFGTGNYGKNVSENYALLGALARFTKSPYHVMVGFSRKSFIGAVLDKDFEGRLYGSVACAVIAAERGVRILRVHDIGPTVDAIKIMQALWENSLDK